MTVKELKEILNEMNDNLEVELRVFDNENWNYHIGNAEGVQESYNNKIIIYYEGV